VKARVEARVSPLIDMWRDAPAGLQLDRHDAPEQRRTQFLNNGLEKAADLRHSAICGKSTTSRLLKRSSVVVDPRKTIVSVFACALQG